jgi:aromatic-L-amino-acid decarboxylase
MVLRHFGAEGLRARLAEHMRLARQFADWVDASEDFERLAPVPFSVVCFRSAPLASRGDEAALDAHNEALVESVNRTGKIFLSHTRLNGRFCIRLAVGNLHTTEQHLTLAWDLLNNSR